MQFVLPEETHRADVTDFYAAFEKNNETCIGFMLHDDYDAWLTQMKNRHTGKSLPEGYVREDFFLCYLQNELVGVFSLKFDLTPYLFQYGGHIGYAVRPDKRNRGIATEILREGLKIARKNGMNDLLLMCDETNPVSEKVIVRCGGVFENKLFDPEENVFVKRFGIRL